MAKSNSKKNDKGAGADFINTQRAVDNATNESVRAESDSNELDPRQVRKHKAERKSDVDVKQSGKPKH